MVLTKNLILLRFCDLKFVGKVIFGNSSAQGWVCILNNVAVISGHSNHDFWIPGQIWGWGSKKMDQQKIVHDKNVDKSGY